MAAAESEKIRLRRVQRLGTSSLVVTLPKEWVRRVNLKPGDTVYVVIEGGSVRIIPSSKAAEAISTLRVDVSRLPRDLSVSKLVSCAYISRVDVLRLEGVGWEAALEARSIASRLMGVDVSSGEGYLEIKTIIDDTRIKPQDIIENVVRLASDLIGLARRLAENPSQQLIQLAREAIHEIVKYEHLVLRRLNAGVPGEETSLLYAVGIAILAAGDLWHLTNYLAALAEQKGGVEVDRDRLEKLLGLIEKVLSLLARAVETSSIDDAVALTREAEKAKMDAWRATLDAPTPQDAVVATHAYHTLRSLELASNALLCHAIHANKKKTTQ